MSNNNLAYRFAQTLTERDEGGYAALLHPEYVNHNALPPPARTDRWASSSRASCPPCPTSV